MYGTDILDFSDDGPGPLVLQLGEIITKIFQVVERLELLVPALHFSVQRRNLLMQALGVI